MDFRKSQAFVDLNGEWSFAYSEGNEVGQYETAQELRLAGYKTLRCSVPGNFELDLHANGVVGEPFFGTNTLELMKYEKSHVWYFREFEATEKPGCNALLTFEGLDCFADVYLNGKLIASTDNMLIEHEINVTGMLKGKNELFVHIRPAVEEAKKYDYPPYVITFPANYEGLYVRKAPHMYGWDIMPRAVSAGIWRPVKLRFLPKERIKGVFLETTAASRDYANMILSYRLTTNGDFGDVYEVAVTGKCEDSTFSSKARASFDAGNLQFGLNKPALWWPNGRGEQNLYDVKVTLLKNGEEIDSLEFTHGIRTVELDRTSITDQAGRGEFCFKINGEKVFVLGTNWAPVDAYHSRDVERIPAILDAVDDLGCNMIRCWGGNVYENDLFFEICDRKGIMIWQDFTMACAAYPQDDEFCKRFETEARQVVKRLRQHPSLVLWAGDNECDWAPGWGGRRGNPNDNVLTRKVLPDVTRTEDPSRLFLPSSPYIDQEAFKAGGTFISENHLWGCRNYYKSDYYKVSLCHFASEIGYHGCPSAESIKKFVSPEKVWPCTNNDEWLLHSTWPVPDICNYPNWVEMMGDQLKEAFGKVPATLEDFCLASQIVHAEAFKFFVELFRSTKWRRTGIIWWNMVDGWPQMSNAIMDYYLEKKLAYSYIKRAQEPLCLMFREPDSWTQELVVANDTRQNSEIEYSVRDVDTGECVVEGSAVAMADSTTILTRVPFFAGHKRFYLIEWKTSDGKSGKNHYLAGHPPFDLEQYRGWMKKAGI